MSTEVSGAGKTTQAALTASQEEFKQAAKENINIGRTSEEMMTFILTAEEKYKNISATDRETILSMAVEDMQRMSSMISNLLNSILQAMSNVIANIRA